MLQGTGIITADKLTRVVKIIVGQAISEELVPELMRGLDSVFDNQISFKNLLRSTAHEGDSETRCRRRAVTSKETMQVVDETTKEQKQTDHVL